MDTTRVQLLRDLLADTEWVTRTAEFAGRLRRPSARRGSLLLVGTPADEPWHLAAHLDDEARLSGIPQLAPTLVRWAPPPGAPPHLSIGLQRIEAVGRGETLFVVAPEPTPASLLERVADARRGGATVLSLDVGDPELGDLAHDRLVVPPGTAAEWRPPAGGTSAERWRPPVDMEIVQHLVSMSAGEPSVRPSMRGRLAQLLDRISGPAPNQ